MIIAKEDLCVLLEFRKHEGKNMVKDEMDLLGTPASPVVDTEEGNSRNQDEALRRPKH